MAKPHSSRGGGNSSSNNDSAHIIGRRAHDTIGAVFGSSANRRGVQEDDSKLYQLLSLNGHKGLPLTISAISAIRSAVALFSTSVDARKAAASKMKTATSVQNFAGEDFDEEIEDFDNESFQSFDPAEPSENLEISIQPNILQVAYLLRRFKYIRVVQHVYGEKV